jgi:acyl carrier protein
MKLPKFIGGDRAVQLRSKVTALLESHNVRLEGEPKESAPLIRSGKLDSLGLFKLALLVEQEVGHEIDIAAFDLAKEWNTINDIVRFITLQRAAG